jgi:ArsR family transcriptional regulator
MPISTDLESRSLEALAGGFGALSDPIRLRILTQLAECDQRCVCDLLRDSGIAPNLLSYHLGVLRRAGLIAAKRRGRWVDYRLVPEALEALSGSVPGLREG